MTKLGDDLKSDEKTLYAKGVARTVIWWGEETRNSLRCNYRLQQTKEIPYNSWGEG